MITSVREMNCQRNLLMEVRYLMWLQNIYLCEELHTAGGLAVSGGGILMYLMWDDDC